MRSRYIIVEKITFSWVVFSNEICIHRQIVKKKKKGKGDFRMAQYGIRDITDLVLKARTRVKIGNQTFQPGQPVVYFTTAQTATLEGAATQVYAQG